MGAKMPLSGMEQGALGFTVKIALKEAKAKLIISNWHLCIITLIINVK
jgi:hypothetical protein